MPPSNRHSAPGLSSRMVSMTRPASARRRLVPPTLRDELRDSVCAEIAVRRTRDRSDISHSSYERRQRRPDAPNLPGRRQFKVADDLWLFAPSQSLGRLVRRGEVAHPRTRQEPPHISPTRRQHPSPPSTRPCRSRAHSRSTPRPRTRSASAGTKARGQVCIRRGGGVWWLAAMLLGYVQARTSRSAPCRPRTAAVVAADGAAGVPCAFASWVRLARS